MLISLCAEQNLTAVEGNASVDQVYPVSRITGEGRAEILRAWGHGSEQEGASGVYTYIHDAATPVENLVRQLAAMKQASLCSLFSLPDSWLFFNHHMVLVLVLWLACILWSGGFRNCARRSFAQRRCSFYTYFPLAVELITCMNNVLSL